MTQLSIENIKYRLDKKIFPIGAKNALQEYKRLIDDFLSSTNWKKSKSNNGWVFYKKSRANLASFSLIDSDGNKHNFNDPSVYIHFPNLDLIANLSTNLYIT
jgi:hypothetical protein